VPGDPAGTDLGALRHEAAEQVDVLVVDPLDVLRVEDRLLLLDRSAVFRRRALLLATLRHLFPLERLFAVFVVVVAAAPRRDRRGTGTALALAAAGEVDVGRTAALDAVDLRGR